MRVEKGDLVACYITNREVYEALLDWGIVLDVNPAVKDILVLDSHGHSRWWPEKRWSILKKTKKVVDSNNKI